MKTGKIIILLLVLGALGTLLVWASAFLLIPILIVSEDFDISSVIGIASSFLLSLFLWLCYGSILSYALEKSDGLRNVFSVIRGWLRSIASCKGVIIILLLILFGYICWQFGRYSDFYF